MNLTIRAAFAATGAAVALLAGGGYANAEPANEGTFTAADRDYLTDLASEQIGTLDGTPRELVELGIATCGALRTNPVQTVVNTGIQAGISEWDTGVLIGAASRNYCPDTWPAVRTWAESV